MQRLVEQINIGKDEFYSENKNKIIFAVSVHSLECWLLPLYKSYKTEKTKNCFNNLQRESKKISVQKDYNTYDKLSKPYLKNKTLLKESKKSTSLKVFVDSLPYIG